MNEKKLRITFDAQPLASEQRTGIEYVTINLIDQLLRRDDVELILQYFDKGKTEAERELVNRYREYGVSIRTCERLRGRVYNAIWMLLPLPYHSYFVPKGDLVHFQANYTPPGVRMKTITTVHDLIPLLHPEWVNFKSRVRARLCAKASCQRADHIITDSQFSKGKIAERCGIALEKITVIPCGVDHNRFHPGYTAGEIEAAKGNYRIDEPYFFYMGSVVPHKNLVRLVEAYAMAAQVRPLPKLVLGGGGWYKDVVAEKARQLGVADRISLIGYVCDEDVAPLMSGAVAFVFPSLYEGFGLPPLEAMACGTPVIVSNAASLPEVVGKAGILLDSYDLNAWRDALLHVSEDENTRERFRVLGLEQAKEFNWDNYCEKTLEVYRKVAGLGEK